MSSMVSSLIIVLTDKVILRPEPLMAQLVTLIIWQC